MTHARTTRHNEALRSALDASKAPRSEAAVNKGHQPERGLGTLRPAQAFEVRWEPSL